ncbi:MAG: biopolymer transport protein ExbB [Puniceicoccaceae bacterium 5H]|nr:MAG: biopolymer transport protein ExbB [Puniceicoccaceae bacterium 5H]
MSRQAGWGLLLAVVLATCRLAAQAPSPQAVAEARLQTSLEELAQVRQENTARIAPLSQEVGALQEQLAALEDRERELRLIQDQRAQDLAALEAAVTSAQEQHDAIYRQLESFAADFSSWIRYSEIPAYEDLIAAAETAREHPDLQPRERLERQLALIDESLIRWRQQEGGRAYYSEALGTDGVLRVGVCYTLGPAVYFESYDGTLSGWVEKRPNSNFATVVSIPGYERLELHDAAEGTPAWLPLDPSNGQALQVVESARRLEDYLRDGGPIGYVILALGATAFALALLKLYWFFNFKTASSSDVAAILRHLQEGHPRAALDCAEKLETVDRELLMTGARHYMEPRAALEEMMYERIVLIRPELERYLPFLSLTVAAAPLLGLLGTVVGMIKTFNLITIFGTGDAKSLSGGISEALITTALGLIVAIPVLLLHGVMSRLARQRVARLEQTAIAFLNGLDLMRPDPNPILTGTAPKHGSC